MGCVASRKIEKDERVQICKERKRLMKQLILTRSQFAAAQMAYLQSLKNTGVTLRQFTDSECLDAEILLPSSSCNELNLPSSPPPLPPPPPPLPPFSPDHDSVEDGAKDEEEGNLEGEDNIGATSPPPTSSWDIWDSVTPPSSSPLHQKQKAEEEDWAETNTDFDNEDEEEKVKENVEVKVFTDIILNPLNEKSLLGVTGLAVPKSKKTSVSGIIKEIDDYFLKASASGRDVILLLDINKGSDPLYQNFGESMRKSGKSSKVFSALSWNWSSRTLHSSKDLTGCYGPDEPCKPGAHGVTLEKIFNEEEKLYKEIKVGGTRRRLIREPMEIETSYDPDSDAEEENTKLEYERKNLLLQKYEVGDQDLLKTEEIRMSIETLQNDICSFQQSISETNSTILKLIDEELHPQLVILSSGLMHMWRTMDECHQIQHHIAQQMNHLTNLQSEEPTTDYHSQSTIQLEAEVSGWYNSFCNLLKSQREYVQVLNSWVQLTDCLVDCQQQRNCLAIVQHLCEFWKVGMDHLPDKAAGEAIKSFLCAIHSVVLQQSEEVMLQKKSGRLEKKLQRETNLLAEMERKFESNGNGDVLSTLSGNHPLAVKRAKIELFKKRVEDEKTKYLNSVQLSRAMTLNNLQTSLPNVFQALSVFSNVCAKAFEGIDHHTSGGESEVSESSGVDIR